ncbi:MAG: hypothetical protein KC635_01540 [Myxococcales bacterium]|nr:hypothetical protein [Myxococcales bacterium]MCB9734610.1 hypothetical protein [Deltaproteobacteria bacterium]
MTMFRTMGMGLCALAIAACGGKGGDAAGGGGEGEKAAGPSVADVKAEVEKAAADVNAKVPEDLKAALTFEAVAGEKDWHVALQPKGWKSSTIPGLVKPPEGGPSLGFMTKFSTGSNCDGACAAKDAAGWKATADKVEFAQFASNGEKIAKDEALPDGRILVANGDRGRVDIVVARWKDGAERYFSCRATLEDDAAKAADAFEAACLAMKPVW